MVTTTVDAELAKDLANTLDRLRLAREIDDKQEIIICNRRLNWLLDKIPRKDH